MHVVYDHQMFALQKHGGITRIFIELMRRLPLRSACGVSWYRGFHVDEYDVATIVSGLKRYQSFDVAGAPLAPAASAALNWAALPHFFDDLGDPAAIYHPTYYESALITAAGQRKLVVTVADLIAERYLISLERFRPHLEDRKRVIQRADLLLAISEHTKKDLAELHGIPPERIVITPLASDFDTLPPGQLPPEVVTLRRPYLLYVGTRSKYKNFDLLFAAFAADKTLKECFDVVVFGGTSGWVQPDLKIMADHGLTSNFHYVRGDDRVLRTLYEHACALVYTSRYEGFGLPPLEAMHCGCPVLCCPVASLPEVVGDAALPIDPDQPEQLATALHQISSDSGLRTRLITAGRLRARKFSWDETARLTAQAYRTLAN